MILIDANIFMYAAGARQEHKEPCLRFLEQVALGEQDGLIDAEVLQEILHRYRAIDRWRDGRRVYDEARLVCPTVLPIEVEHLDIARRLLDEHADLSARDALHAAVCRHRGLRGLCSYDRGFDQVPDVERFEPGRAG